MWRDMICNNLRDMGISEGACMVHRSHIVKSSKAYTQLKDSFVGEITRDNHHRWQELNNQFVRFNTNNARDAINRRQGEATVLS